MADTGEMITRTIQRVWAPAARTMSPIHRAAMILEPGEPTRYDPFIFLAEDWFEQGTFDVHPHRGIETVTYVIEGHLKHYDNKFGEGELAPGDVQWMTAGRGVIHREDPVPGEVVHSLQLWVNLPRSEKMAEPRYQNLRRADVPVRREPGVTVTVFSGESGNVHSETKNHVPVTMVEIELEPRTTFAQELPGDYEGFLYVLEGTGTFGSNHVTASQGQALELGSAALGAPSEVIVNSGVNHVRVLLYAGRPLHERIVAYGPFVMNTEAEIKQAILDYQTGKFGE